MCKKSARAAVLKLPFHGGVLGKPRTRNRAFWKLREKESEGLDQSRKETEGGRAVGSGRWVTEA